MLSCFPPLLSPFVFMSSQDALNGHYLARAGIEKVGSRGHMTRRATRWRRQHIGDATDRVDGRDVWKEIRTTTCPHDLPARERPRKQLCRLLIVLAPRPKSNPECSRLDRPDLWASGQERASAVFLGTTGILERKSGREGQRRGGEVKVFVPPAAN